MFCCSFAVLIITTEEFTYAVPSLFEVHLLSYWKCCEHRHSLSSRTRMLETPEQTRKMILIFQRAPSQPGMSIIPSTLSVLSYFPL